MSEALSDPEAFLRKEWEMEINYDEENKEDEFVSLEQITARPVTKFIIYEESDICDDILMGDYVEN